MRLENCGILVWFFCKCHLVKSQSVDFGSCENTAFLYCDYLGGIKLLVNHCHQNIADGKAIELEKGPCQLQTLLLCLLFAIDHATVLELCLQGSTFICNT